MVPDFKVSTQPKVRKLMLIDTPETLQDDIVCPAASAVHAYFYSLLDDGSFPISVTYTDFLDRY